MFGRVYIQTIKWYKKGQWYHFLVWQISVSEDNWHTIAAMGTNFDLFCSHMRPEISTSLSYVLSPNKPDFVKYLNVIYLPCVVVIFADVSEYARGSHLTFWRGRPRHNSGLWYILIIIGGIDSSSFLATKITDSVCVGRVCVGAYHNNYYIENHKTDKSTKLE